MAKTDKPRGIQRRAQRETRPNPNAFINAAQGGGEGEADSEHAVDALSPAPAKPKGHRVTFNLRLSAEEHAMLSAVARATNRSKHDVCMTLLVPALEKAHDRFVEDFHT